MYPAIKSKKKFYFKVGKKHNLYVEECGNKKGVPIVYLHGGPGGCINPDNRRLFNPKKYRIILFDQRGTGKSKPNKLIESNTTNFLINDIEKIRKKLNINKWIVVGGSWGSTLGLAYAIRHSKSVLGLVLRGVFLGTKEEAFWAFNDAAKYFYPEIIEKIEDKINKKKRNNIFMEIGKIIDQSNKKRGKMASQIWSNYERALSVLNPGSKLLKNILKFDTKKGTPNSPLLEWHYTKNNFFLKKNEIILGLKKIKKKPTIIVQGRYDLICPPRSAHQISKKLINSELRIIEESGHSSSEKEIKKNLIKAINDIYRLVRKK